MMTDQQVRRRIAHHVLILAAVGFAAITFFAGHRLGAHLAQDRELQYATASSRVMQLVVERNPAARIRDFEGFTEALFAAANDAGVDYRLVLAMIDKESGFRPDAVGGAGEVGLMQILPATGALMARARGEEFTAPTRARAGGYADLGTLGDPKANVRLGVAYLAEQLKRYRLLPVALRAYNRNPDRALEHRPADRYAEDIALKYLVMAGRAR